MAIFRCKRSGNTVSFSNLDDVRGLRQHEGYEEVLNEEIPKFLKEISGQSTKGDIGHSSESQNDHETRKDDEQETGQVLKRRGRKSKSVM